MSVVCSQERPLIAAYSVELAISQASAREAAFRAPSSGDEMAAEGEGR